MPPYTPYLQREGARHQPEHKANIQPAVRIQHPQASDYINCLFHFPHLPVDYSLAIWEAEHACLLSVFQNQLGFSHDPGQPRRGDLQVGEITDTIGSPYNTTVHA